MSNKVTVVMIEQTEPQQDVFTLRELCERTEVHAEFVIKLVSYGIISPVRDCPAAEWCFDLNALVRLQKAQRLQRDLNLNLPGLAVSLDLLDDVRNLRREVARLNQQLAQFLG
ncbi:chaperone modulator CbpM [Marinobacter sp. X15-166B]|uniref:chaperone modulator CbpM n=1 Tax=Marinobacter sp. X15-166B TaxID=1897620 RepID=UPI00085C6EBE|nr:chaperone modulator CbpM [Marinobacter sp. X15-166B]OEY67883.1 molecular chaperone [Marinobacter sp. X15-166B]